MSTREIIGHLHDLYGIDVSPDLISTVTDAVLDEVATWHQRPLDPIYPPVFFDALRVKIRDEGIVRNKGTSLEKSAEVIFSTEKQVCTSLPTDFISILNSF
ncbi:putative transposase [Sphingobium sp. SYK-6]|nr:putative transposase [Sphingobium sp. SYK-6]